MKMIIKILEFIKVNRIDLLRFCLYFSSLSFYSFPSVAQDSILIQGQLLNNSRFVKIVVQKFGDGVFDIAALPIEKETGRFSITAPPDVAPGVYRLRYGQTNFMDYVDVIINGEDKLISFSIDVSKSPIDRVPNFISSEENKSWNQFTSMQKELLVSIKVHQDFLNAYAYKKDKVYKTILKAYDKAKVKYHKQYNSFVKTSPFYWAKYMAQFNKVDFSNLSEHKRIQQYNLHETYWHGKPTNEVKLLNTPLYIDAILSYLQYYLNPEVDFGEHEQNIGFKKCVDEIILTFSSNDSLKQFAIKYLQMGFKELGNETLLQYLDEKYASNLQCSLKDIDLNKRLEAYKSLKPGNPAPNISFSDLNGNTITLKDLSKDTVLVVFWASWCPHCIQEMPKVQEWAKAHSNVQVLAVSLDDDFALFESSSKKFPDMLHYCDLQKWESEVVKKFHVIATPTFYFLDKNRTIISKQTKI